MMILKNDRRLVFPFSLYGLCYHKTINRDVVQEEKMQNRSQESFFPFSSPKSIYSITHTPAWSLTNATHEILVALAVSDIN